MITVSNYIQHVVQSKVMQMQKADADQPWPFCVLLAWIPQKAFNSREQQISQMYTRIK